jgi:hypothetical protein
LVERIESAYGIVCFCVRTIDGYDDFGKIGADILKSFLEKKTVGKKRLLDILFGEDGANLGKVAPGKRFPAGIDDVLQAKI